MRRLPAAALVWTGSAMSTGCGHAHHTDASGPNRPTEAAAAPAEHSTQHEAKPKAVPDAAPDAVPVAASPDALLEPGAEKKIRDRLIAGGFLAKDAGDAGGPTREALRRFQRAQDLPATGMPDHKTAQKLGLDPNELFRRAGP